MIKERLSEAVAEDFEKAKVEHPEYGEVKLDGVYEDRIGVKHRVVDIRHRPADKRLKSPSFTIVCQKIDTNLIMGCSVDDFVGTFNISGVEVRRFTLVNRPS